MTTSVILSSQQSSGPEFFIFLVASLTIFLSIFIPIYTIRNKYKKFVDIHSVALKQLRNINSKYLFKKIPDFDLKHSYDNENFYAHISCKDYLIYQLVYMQKSVSKAINDIHVNEKMFYHYKEEIENTCSLNQYDTKELLKNKKRLKRYEEKMFEKEIQTPTIEFAIVVTLRLTKINGHFRRSKYNEFSEADVNNLIEKLNHKKGNFYLENEIWDSICRVERGKVTNKMRFAVYDRDHYRCRKCGRRTKDLEVDHIIPIAKGGKSTFNNLQTLCHRCNVKKGTKIEF